MSETQDKMKVVHMCMNCAHKHEQWANLHGRIKYISCPKCGRGSLPFGIAGTGAMIEHLVNDNIKLRNEIYDLKNGDTSVES